MPSAPEPRRGSCPLTWCRRRRDFLIQLLELARHAVERLLHLLEPGLLPRKRRDQVRLYRALTLGALSELLLSRADLSNLRLAIGTLDGVGLEHERRFELLGSRLKLIGLRLRLARGGARVGNLPLELCDVLLLGDQELGLNRAEAGRLQNPTEEPDLPEKLPYCRIPNDVRRRGLRNGSPGQQDADERSGDDAKQPS